MEIVAIVLSLFLLVTFAYRGFSVILFAPIFALFAASFSGLPILPGYTELFMAKAVMYIKSFFPVFLLGAVFGKVMEETGMARSIAMETIRIIGKDKAIFAVVFACMILCYGGISMFVCAFAVYPFAAALFKEADIPKHLIPACFIAGVFTATMDCYPGSPQIQNIIPTIYLGTTTFAAPILGFISGTLLVISSLAYLEWRRKMCKKKGEGYGNHTLNETIIDPNATLPPWQISIIPLLVVLILNFYFSMVFQWNDSLLEPFRALNVPLLAKSVHNVIAIWALLIGLLAAVIIACATGHKFMSKNTTVKAALNAGALGSLLAIMNTASEVGYGNVISSLPGFMEVAHALLGVGQSMPLFNAAIMVNILAGITGSASGGLSIALDIFGQHFLQATAAQGIPPEVLHRVVAMASGGMDSLPHNGAVITTLAICGLTHREAYKDMFAITLLKVVFAFFAVFFYMATGIY
ncbi:transporter [Megasphaera cerevisiae DSM 20462]|jgi:H+/gluconate symporter-like permease|uniref:Transporter n=1 Tax=Megasphaera cerevisiae DSM 20462 TaxID=1122219 RepID=A0A0J6WZC1_9FIRM|nr:GntP family permease [Megasphaera cerevisiae]KMO87588.1 transporter [Megasphaera cerevisiae DSM 20462]OKY54704.1 transporter [Megasphaera cerevisiae]SJZ65500.1 H+/gluconate symporter [Megasphaera cerevisiae DSM 20462]